MRRAFGGGDPAGQVVRGAFFIFSRNPTSSLGASRPRAQRQIIQLEGPFQQLGLRFVRDGRNGPIELLYLRRTLWRTSDEEVLRAIPYRCAATSFKDGVS